MNHNVFIIIIGLFFCNSQLFALVQYDTVYVDPTSDGTNEGTLENPKTKLSKTTIADSTVFLLKGGIIYGESLVIENVSDVIVQSYGTGQAVVTQCRIGGGKNITVKKIDVSGSGQYSVGMNVGDSEQVLLDSIKVYGTGTESENLYFGLRGGNVTGLTVTHCEFYHLRTDAIYMNFLTDAEFAYNHIHNVNMSNGPGDGIQLSADQHNIFIHHNRIDRSGSTGKFCVIFSGNSSASDIRIENNHFSGPDDGGGGAGVFFAAPVPEPAFIRWNTFENCPTGLYIHTNANVGHNIFIGNGAGINNQSGIVNIGNNVFYDNGSAVSTVNSGFVKNNIVYLTNDEQEGIYLTDENNAGHNMINRALENTPDWMTVADPLFIDIENHDFRLQENSPAIDAGTDINFDYDYDGNINHCNGAPDLGAFETQKNCPEVQNFAPVIVAPSDTVLQAKGKFVMDLRRSYDLDDTAFIYHWQFPDILDVIPYAENQSVVAAYMPEIDRDTTISVLVYISDGRLNSDTAEISIQILRENAQPIASAGSAIQLTEMDWTMLDGSQSYDPEGQSLDYFWSVISPVASLSGNSSETPLLYSSEVDADTTFYVYLNVFDGLSFSNTDSVAITILNKVETNSTEPQTTNRTDNATSNPTSVKATSSYAKDIVLIKLIDLQGRVLRQIHNPTPEIIESQKRETVQFIEIHYVDGTMKTERL